jgi:hypothetical protein
MNPKEDYLKILKVEYLSNHGSDIIQILNLSYRDQTNVYRSLKLKTTSTEDNLKNLKVEYLSYGRGKSFLPKMFIW